MLGSGVIGFTQHRLERVWSSRLSEPLRPASAGPLRHWQDQVRLAVKGAIAAVAPALSSMKDRRLLVNPDWAGQSHRGRAHKQASP